MVGGLIWKRFAFFLLKGFFGGFSEKINLHVKSGIQSQGNSNDNITLSSKEEGVNKHQSLAVLRTVMLASDTVYTEFCWKLSVVVFRNAISPLLVLS